MVIRLQISESAAFFLFDVFLRLTTDVVAEDFSRDFGLDADALSPACSTPFFLSYAVVQLPGGFTLDRFRPRRTLAAAWPADRVRQ